MDSAAVPFSKLNPAKPSGRVDRKIQNSEINITHGFTKYKKVVILAGVNQWA
jgi:hypothetical protein